MTKSAGKGRTVLLVALAAIVLLETLIASATHRDRDELLRVVREGIGDSTIAAIHRLARRDDGRALSGVSFDTIESRNDPRLLAFLLLASPRDVDLEPIRRQYRAWGEASGDPARARLRSKKMKTLDEIRFALRTSRAPDSGEAR